MGRLFCTRKKKIIRHNPFDEYRMEETVKYGAAKGGTGKGEATKEKK